MSACRKCGEEVAISEALSAEMVKVSRDGTAVVEHDVCPRDEGELQRFAIEIHVVRQGEGDQKDELAFFKVEHEAATFTDALPVLAQRLGPKWDQLQKTAAIVDQDLDG